jgi:hypothetical protein
MARLPPAEFPRGDEQEAQAGGNNKQGGVSKATQSSRKQGKR